MQPPPPKQQASVQIVSAPSLNLPTPRGALRGLGQSVSVSPALGTSALSIPVPVTAGRGAPSLTLRYDSGGGNGVFGLGWSLSVPAIEIQTQRRLPSYDRRDVYQLSGVGELVPSTDPADVDLPARDGHEIVRYRPRHDGASIRIERWRGAGVDAWRVLSADGGVSWFGRVPGHRVEDAGRTFRWLLDRRTDAAGNTTRYVWVPEASLGGLTSPGRCLRAIHYGNRIPDDPRSIAPADPLDPDRFAFEIRLDHGDGAGIVPPAPDRLRPDVQRRCRASFEVLTSLLCRRIVVLHHDPSRGVDAEPIRSLELGYDQRAQGTRLVRVHLRGFGATDDDLQRPHLDGPPIQLAYSEAEIARQATAVTRTSLEGACAGLADPRVQLLDLDGEGVPGLLIRGSGGAWFKRGLGDGAFDPPVPLRSLPDAPLTARFEDLEGDGRIALVRDEGSHPRSDDGSWGDLIPSEGRPTAPTAPGRGWRASLDGTGRRGVLEALDHALAWHRGLGARGLELPRLEALPQDLDRRPVHLATDDATFVALADMSGDGLPDLVRIRAGEVVIWSGLGRGRFGPPRILPGSLALAPSRFDPARIRLGDTDGSGTSDVVYLGEDGISLLRNQSGARLADPIVLDALPPHDSLSDVQIVDLLGTGLPVLAWSTALPQGPALRYLPLLEGVRPGLLTSVDHGSGAIDRIHYAPSTRDYLRDRAEGRPWATKLPYPVWVVEQIDHEDAITELSVSESYRYRHGCFDPDERTFCGFAFVEQRDTEHGAALGPDAAAPVVIRTWTHPGLPLSASGTRGLLEAIAAEQHPCSAPALLADPDPSLDAAAAREAARALRGAPLCVETYMDDGDAKASVPLQIMHTRWQTRWLQPPHDDHPGATLRLAERTWTSHRERSADEPRVSVSAVLEHDPLGVPLVSVRVALPRAPGPDDDTRHPDQHETHVVTTHRAVHHRLDDPDDLRVGLPLSEHGVAWPDAALPPDEAPSIDDLRALVAGPVAVEAEDRIAGGGLLLSASCRLYRGADLDTPLPFGQVGPSGRMFASYALEHTPGLLAGAFEPLGADAPQSLATLLAQGGHVQHDALGHALADHLPGLALQGCWWLHGGTERLGAFALPIATVDPFGATHTIHWDEDHLTVVQVDDPLGRSTSIALDPRTRQPIEQIAADGTRTGASYDLLGRIVASWAQGRPGEGEGDTRDAPTTTTTYDDHAWERGQPRSVRTRARETHGATDTRWQTTIAYLDGRDGIAQTKSSARSDASGPRWRVSGRVVRDRKGRVRKQFEPFFSAHDAHEPDAEATTHGVASLLSYDALGRTIQIDHPDGTLERTVVSPWHTAAWDRQDTVRDSAWLAVRRQPGVDPELQRAGALSEALAEAPTQTVSDALGRPVRTTVRGVERPPVTETIYDLRGQLASTLVTRYDGGPDDPPAARTLEASRVWRSLSGRVLSERSPDAGRTMALPDVAGQPLWRWGARRHAWRTEVDALRRPTHVWRSDPGDPGTEVLEERVLYAEDVADREAVATAHLLGEALLRFDGAGVQQVLAADFRGRPTATRRWLCASPQAPDWGVLADATEVDDALALAAGLLGEEASHAFTSTQALDALDRVVLQGAPALPDQPAAQTQNAYDEGGALVAVAVQLPGEVDPRTIVSDIERNARGQRTLITYGNGARTHTTYDPLTWRLARLHTTRPDPNGAPQTIQDLRYTYDALGSPVAITDGAVATTWSSNAAVEPVRRFRYDALGQLIEATGREHPSASVAGIELPDASAGSPHVNDGSALRPYTRTYRYDATGNLLQLTHSAGGERWVRTLEPEPGSNRLASATLGDVTHRYAYDDAGSMQRMSHLEQLRFDPHQRLAGLTRGTLSADYAYDAGGERARKWIEASGTVRERLYLGAAERYLERRSGQLHTARETLHVHDGDQRVALIEIATRLEGTDHPEPQIRVRYQLGDRLQTVHLELDDAAQVISEEEHHPYGTVAWRRGDPGLEGSARRYRYTGKERDEESGLSYHSARYYAPWLGRWTAADPAGMADGPNRHAYALGAPTERSDRSGTTSRSGNTLSDPQAARAAQIFKTKKKLKQLNTALMAQQSALSAIDTDSPAIPGMVDAVSILERQIQSTSQKLASLKRQEEQATQAARKLAPQALTRATIRKALKEQQRNAPVLALELHASGAAFIEIGPVFGSDAQLGVSGGVTWRKVIAGGEAWVGTAGAGSKNTSGSSFVRVRGGIAIFGAEAHAHPKDGVKKVSAGFQRSVGITQGGLSGSAGVSLSAHASFSEDPEGTAVGIELGGWVSGGIATTTSDGWVPELRVLGASGSVGVRLRGASLDVMSGMGETVGEWIAGPLPSKQHVSFTPQQLQEERESFEDYVILKQSGFFSSKQALELTK